jgi:hypothetical protein
MSATPFAFQLKLVPNSTGSIENENVRIISQLIQLLSTTPSQVDAGLPNAVKNVKTTVQNSTLMHSTLLPRMMVHDPRQIYTDWNHFSALA